MVKNKVVKYWNKLWQPYLWFKPCFKPLLIEYYCDSGEYFGK